VALVLALFVIVIGYGLYDTVVGAADDSIDEERDGIEDDVPDSGLIPVENEENLTYQKCEGVRTCLKAS